jgi:Flp pilus assembly protein TadG
MQRRRGGSSIIEFTLIGIPVIFTLISIFEVSRTMWVYHTLSNAVREGNRLAIVHGVNCVHDPAVPASNNCQVTVADVAARIRYMGIGLNPAELQLEFVARSAYTSTAAPQVVRCRLDACLADTTSWPPAGNNMPGSDLTEVNAVYPMRTAIAMFWPGAGATSFGVFNLPATSREMVQF